MFKEIKFNGAGNSKFIMTRDRKKVEVIHVPDDGSFLNPTYVIKASYHNGRMGKVRCNNNLYFMPENERRQSILRIGSEFPSFFGAIPEVEEPEEADRDDDLLDDVFQI